jgi:hypothetical protein
MQRVRRGRQPRRVVEEVRRRWYDLLSYERFLWWADRHALARWRQRWPLWLLRLRFRYVHWRGRRWEVRGLLLSDEFARRGM